MKSSDMIDAVQPVVHVFAELDIAYCIGGSVGSSVHGVARTTLDIDLVANLGEKHIKFFVKKLQSDYYVEQRLIGDAIQNKGSFNLIHLETMVKVDIFILKDNAFDRQLFSRKRKELLDPEEGVEFFVATPEDIVLHKLLWYRMGDHVSERQWGDILGVLRVQENQLDLKYLWHWARQLTVEDLLDRALKSV